MRALPFTESEPTRRILLFLLAVTAASVMGGPLIWMTISSLKMPQELYQTPPTFLPARATLQNYKELFFQTEFSSYFANSLIVACGTTVLCLAISGLAAYSLARFRFPGLKSFAVATLLAYLLPEALLVIPLYTMAVHLSLSDSLFGLVLANTAFALPMSLWYMRSYFATMPPALEEAAMIDGCTRLGAFRRVTVPLALPGFASVGMLIFNGAWNEYLLSLVLISSERKKVLPLGLATWIGQDSLYSWGMLLAGSVLLTLFSIFVFLLAQRHLTEGLMNGSIK